MKLPNGDRGIVDVQKLAGYCLDPHHPRGRNKARVFAAIGIRQEHAEELRTVLLAAAQSGDAQPGEASPYGERYIIDFEMTRAERLVTIRSAWILRTGEETPRLTTCYVL